MLPVRWAEHAESESEHARMTGCLCAGWTRAKQLAEEAAAVVRNSKEGGHVVTAENAGMLRLEAAIV